MVNFEQSMNISKEYRERNNSEKWEYLKTLYNNLDNKSEEKIPKIIHQIWIGGVIPPHLKDLSQQWKNLCEKNGWLYYLWDDTNIDKFPNKNIEKTKNYGQKSDILRYDILKKYGGVYVDIDFVPIKIFDESVLKTNFFAGIAFGKDPVLFNGLIGTIPEGSLINELCKIEKINDKDAKKIMFTTGPYYLTNKFFKSDDDDVVAYPFTYFYPYSNRKWDRDKGTDYRNYIKDETYCVHLWNCSWMKW
tara:strand:- start:1286 stop:2026 length:741 start_codon:yes stop_codon:yes gene_type:complete